jgi:hypothetical protein
MKLGDFFSKDVKVMPSGQKADEESVRVSKYAKPLLKAVKYSAGAAAMATLLASCGASYSEIDVMKEKVPEAQRREITLNYDEMLLNKIDSVYDARGDMWDAVSVGLDEAREAAEAKMPSERSGWTGKDYVLADHMKRREKEGHPKVLSVGSHDFYKVNTDFRDKLMKSVNKQKWALEEAAIAKSGRGSR